MTNERKNQLFSALFTDEAATQAALQMTPEQVQAKLAESGLAYSIEEITELGKELAAMTEKLAHGEELTAEELQSIAGGKAVISRADEKKTTSSQSSFMKSLWNWLCSW